MEKQIFNQKLRMIIVMILMFALVGWQHHFVMGGIKANPYLNYSIIGVFLLGCGIAFRMMSSLKNEVLALDALKVDFSGKTYDVQEIYSKPAIVFKDPLLIGHAYRLISEELCKHGKLIISHATVHSLIGGVEVRMNDRRGTMMYLSGLMVFMGLFGTFVGLMETVASVGGIINNLDFSGGKSADAAFGNLITGLKAPLNGMATGFSSSLFGLSTSLVLGLHERFSTAAARVLKVEFESWLTNLAHLEQAEGDEQEIATGKSHDIDILRRISRVETNLTQAHSVGQATQRAVGEMAIAVRSLADHVHAAETSRPDKNAVYTVLTQLANEQKRLAEHAIEQGAGSDVDRAHMSFLMEEMLTLFEHGKSEQSQQVQSLQTLTDVLSASLDRHALTTELNATVFAAKTGEPAATHARGLLERLGSVFVSDNHREAKATNTSASIKMMDKMLRQTHSMQQQWQSQLERSRAISLTDQTVFKRFIGQQHKLMTYMASLTNRFDAQQSETDVSSHVTQLGEDIKQSRTVTELAMQRLESRIAHSQHLTENALSTAHEALEVASSKLASHG